MRIKIKKLDKDAIIPKYAHYGDAAVDLVATYRSWDEDARVACYGTGLAIEIPHGYVGLIFPRSSVSNTSLRLANSVGVIDSGYRGEIMLKYDPKDNSDYIYEPGDRIGQLMILPLPSIQFFEVEELSTSVRDIGGFGSSGR